MRTQASSGCFFVQLLIAVIVLSASPLYSQQLTMIQHSTKDFGVNWVGPVKLDDGSLLYGTDNGQLVHARVENGSYELIDVGTCADLTAISTNGRYVIVGDHDGVVHVSSDLGRTWRSVALNDGPIKATTSSAETRAFIGTSSGSVVSLDPAELTYEVLFHDGSAEIVWMDDSREVTLVAFRYGRLLHSSDKGQTWSQFRHDSSHDFVSGHRYDDSTIIMGGYLTSVFISRDQGATFTKATPIKTYSDTWAG
ncbi:MAG: hypothetical protein EHM43_05790, partial [Ignavibacteriae bacterium]